MADADGDGNVTNWEFYMALDPNSAYLNDYVFDNFLWDHCEGGAIASDTDSSTKQAFFGGLLRQDSFTLGQVALLMGVLVGLVVLFTFVQVGGLRLSKGEDMRVMSTVGTPYSTHEYFSRQQQQQQGAQYGYNTIGKN